MMTYLNFYVFIIITEVYIVNDLEIEYSSNIDATITAKKL